MMEYMVDRRGIPMDVLTRMKIEERLEFLPQTGKEEACICFPYLEDGVMKNMKFRDAAKHFKMVKGAELIPWNIGDPKVSSVPALALLVRESKNDDPVVMALAAPESPPPTEAIAFDFCAREEVGSWMILIASNAS